MKSVELLATEREEHEAAQTRALAVAAEGRRSAVLRLKDMNAALKIKLQGAGGRCYAVHLLTADPPSPFLLKHAP
eukprot:SAG22_NODE_2654_length_2333_cov_207.686213_2_plen_75_part_00